MAKIPVIRIIAATALVTIAISVLLLLLPQLRNEVAAAWAQGVLTALGIGAAMYSANQQAQDAQAHAEEVRHSDLTQKRQGVMAIAEAALEPIEALEKARVSRCLVVYFEEEYHKEQFVHTLDALKAIPLHDLQSYNMVVGIIDLIDALVLSQNFCHMVVDEQRGTALPEEFYDAYQGDNHTKAMHALTFIRGGILGWSTEEINRKNAE